MCLMYLYFAGLRLRQGRRGTKQRNLCVAPSSWALLEGAGSDHVRYRPALLLQCSGIASHKHTKQQIKMNVSSDPKGGAVNE